MGPMSELCPFGVIRTTHPNTVALLDPCWKNATSASTTARNLTHARLKKVWQLMWSREDKASTVLPYEGGIHRVGNPSESLAISMHLYGPPIGEVDGRDYDPCRNFVCDRLVA